MPVYPGALRWRLPQEVESRITRDYIARLNSDDRHYSSDDLIDISDGADALLITQQDVMGAQVISRVPSSKHLHKTRHPIMRSLEPGETWGWCYVDQIELDELP